MINKFNEIQRRRLNGDDEGFTLIELLIVIIVLGILAAVVVFSLGSVTSTSAKAACNSDAKTVETAVEAYRANVGNVTALTGTAGQAVLTSTATAGGPYLRSWPANASHYIITLDATTAGQVDVQTSNSAGTTGATVVYDSQGTNTGCNAVS